MIIHPTRLTKPTHPSVNKESDYGSKTEPLRIVVKIVLRNIEQPADPQNEETMSLWLFPIYLN